jgi:RsiW-degrading membrane proteinase PrsW (M82 family)
MWSLNRLVGKMNNVMFVGDSLGNDISLFRLEKAYISTASNSDFFESTMKYILVAGICEEVLQFTPATLVP